MQSCSSQDFSARCSCHSDAGNHHSISAALRTRATTSVVSQACRSRACKILKVERTWYTIHIFFDKDEESTVECAVKHFTVDRGAHLSAGKKPSPERLRPHWSCGHRVRSSVAFADTTPRKGGLPGRPWHELSSRPKKKRFSPLEMTVRMIFDLVLA